VSPTEYVITVVVIVVVSAVVIVVVDDVSNGLVMVVRSTADSDPIRCKCRVRL